MKLSDARKRANDKWRDKFDEVRFRVPKGEKTVIQEHAKTQSESTNAFIYRAVKETMARDQQKPDTDNN